MGKYLQISQGKSVWGRETEPRTVLYFSLEDTLGRLQERLYQLVDAEEDPERLILQTESNGIGQGLEERIVSFIHAYPDISLIVIDTLQKALGHGTQEVGKLILKIDSLPADKKATFSTEEIHLMCTTVNQLRNDRLAKGQYTDAADDMLLKLF